MVLFTQSQSNLKRVTAPDLQSENKLKLSITNPLNWCLGFTIFKSIELVFGFSLFTICSSIFGLWLVPFLVLKFKYSLAVASFLSGIGTVSTGVGSVVLGYLSSRFRNRKIYFIISNAGFGVGNNYFYLV